MTEIRVVIVDDEALARERVRTLLELEPGITVVAECSGGREAVGAIVELQPDLVFLDVQMPDLDAFRVIEAVGEDASPVVVFVTAYDGYALRAFDSRALDYVLKPIEPSRFARALERVRQRFVGDMVRHVGAAIEERSVIAPQVDRILIRTPAKVLLLKPSEVDWIEADGKYLKLHVGRQVHVTRQQIGRMERRLAPHGFVRIHRSAIVNVECIRELHPWFHGQYVVVLGDGTKLTSSAAHSAALHRIIDAAK